MIVDDWKGFRGQGCGGVRIDLILLRQNVSVGTGQLRKARSYNPSRLINPGRTVLLYRIELYRPSAQVVRYKVGCRLPLLVPDSEGECDVFTTPPVVTRVQREEPRRNS